MSRRVVITGMGSITPLGTGWETIRESLRSGRSGVVSVPSLEEIEGMRTRLGALVPDFENPPHFTRKKMRTVGKVARYAIRATELALEEAGLLGVELLSSGRVGISYGSTSGSNSEAQSYMTAVGIDKDIRTIPGSQYIKFMSHTCAANLSHYFQTRGRLLSNATACTSGSQSIGYGYEAIKSGAQEIMLCGGAEEFDQFAVTTFDVLYATSSRSDEPSKTPRPFDAARDGLVLGEGAATLVLESLESAQARGATILAEVLGFATNSDGEHMVNPSREGMEQVMKLALENCSVALEDIDYISAHGTATEVGDIAESQATATLFGRTVPVSSLKSYTGHTLGACGAIEAAVAVRQMREGWVAPTLNLEIVDNRCGDLDYVQEIREIDQQIIMSNNFAFGGVNTSLLFKRWDA